MIVSAFVGGMLLGYLLRCVGIKSAPPAPSDFQLRVDQFGHVRVMYVGPRRTVIGG